MEIERKWMVCGWPEEVLNTENMRLLYVELQEQGYIHTDAPIVRIRKETRQECAGEREALCHQDGAQERTQYILCFKSAGLLVREEIEIPVSREEFERLANLIGQALIQKERRVYQLPDGLKLEVNLVDEGLETEFMYAEVEFAQEAQAVSWDPKDAGLSSYLADDVTNQPGQSMSAFWSRTRGCSLGNTD